MKNLIVSLVTFCLTLGFSNNSLSYTLDLTDGKHVQIDMNDWEYLSDEENYHFYLTKTNDYETDGFYKVYSLTLYKKEEIYQNLKAPVNRVITYGYMNCEQEAFYLMGQIFMDKNNEILYISERTFGEQIIELSSPNTPRNKAYVKVCKLGKSI